MVKITQGKGHVSKTRYKTHGKGAGRKERSVLRIHVGYRSLIDWAEAISWKNIYFKSTSKAIRSTPDAWMGKGPPAAPGSSNLIGGGGGSIGAAWNVANPTIPSFSGSKQDIRDSFTNFTPQWLYRLAEIASNTGATMSQIEKEIATDKAGTSKASIASGESQIGIRMGATKGGSLELKFDEKGKAVMKENKAGEKYQVKERVGGEREVITGGTPNVPSAWKMLPLLKDKYKNYTTTFAKNVLNNIDTTIPKQMESFKQAMLRNAPEAKEEIEKATTKGRDIQQTGGQTITEKMGEIGGASTSPESQVLQKGGRPTREYDPMGEWGGSNPIDLKFTREITVGAGDDKTEFSQADTTTSTYQSGSHHGIGLTDINAAVKFDKDNLVPLREKIQAEQNTRIDRYNEIIKVLRSLEYGTSEKGKTVKGSDLGLVELRRKLAAEHLGGRKHAYDDNQALLEVSQINRDMSVVREAIGNVIEFESDTQLTKAVEHVLHAIGIYAGGDMWASMMNLEVIYPVRQEGLATLILNYGWTSEDLFKRLDISEVQIVEDSVIHWIYKHRDDSNKQLTFVQLRDSANESLAVEGYAAVSATGTLVAQVGSSARVHETAHMAMPIEGELAGIIDDVSTNVILRVAGGLETQMSSELIKEATTFSSNMRMPGLMRNIPEWVDAFASAFLGADDYMKEAGSDHFSFLWATPYVSTIYPRLGGAEQHTGA